MVSAGIWLELLAWWSWLQASHSSPARILQGGGLFLGSCSGASPALEWASSFSKASMGLKVPLCIYLESKDLLHLGPAAPC